MNVPSGFRKHVSELNGFFFRILLMRADSFIDVISLQNVLQLFSFALRRMDLKSAFPSLYALMVS